MPEYYEDTGQGPPQGLWMPPGIMAGSVFWPAPGKMIDPPPDIPNSY